MEEQTIIIPNLALAGYRSFGKEPQYFDQFAKINLFIGQNNAGKSNVLRFLSEVYPQQPDDDDGNTKEKSVLDDLDTHYPDNPLTLLGIGKELSESNADGSGRWTFYNHWIGYDNTTGEHYYTRNGADSNLSGSEIDNLSNEQETDWLPIRPYPIKVQLIPAIRRIGEKGSSSDTFDGTGIIDRLARLQNPGVHSQHERERFNEITDFLRDVVDHPDAVLEIPYERDTIHVHMDGRVLPIESLGTGIHEVVILATAATVLSKYVVCIEEPELHLNPILQRKLIRYLAAHTSNQYFITTHSAVLMDVPDAEIYHIKLVKGASVVERVTSGRQKSAVCEDLGYHPSDLLQANCIIWVEGPSDRIYLNWWLKSMAPELVEGIHYSIMFYGGSLLLHLSNDDIEDADVNGFISLRRMNSRSVILIDSDRKSAHSRINETKQRLRDEFDDGPGHAWITEGREIENYLPAEQVEAAVRVVCPKAKKRGPFGKYDNTLKIQGARGKETQANKVNVARHITEQGQPDLSMYNLKAQLNKLTKFILESNPAPASSEKKLLVGN